MKNYKMGRKAQCISITITDNNDNITNNVAIATVPSVHDIYGRITLYILFYRGAQYSLPRSPSLFINTQYKIEFSDLSFFCVLHFGIGFRCQFKHIPNDRIPCANVTLQCIPVESIEYSIVCLNSHNNNNNNNNHLHPPMLSLFYASTVGPFY